jgi:hypothetical protein
MSVGCFETACRSKLSKLVGLYENLVLCLCLMYLNWIKFTLQVCLYWTKKWQLYFGIRQKWTVLLIITAFSGKHFRVTSTFCRAKTRGHRQILNSNCVWYRKCLFLQVKDEFSEPNHPIYSRDFRKSKAPNGALTALMYLLFLTDH